MLAIKQLKVSLCCRWDKIDLSKIIKVCKGFRSRLEEIVEHQQNCGSTKR